ncbi:MAG: hypothetical protein EHM33_14500, partial [Chloroflexi bacterium]
MKRTFNLFSLFMIWILMSGLTFGAMPVTGAYALSGEASPASQTGNPRLFGTIGNADTGLTSMLVELDPVTGAWLTTIGDIGYLVSGLDYDPVSGILFATTSLNDGTFENGLLIINMQTGEGTPVGSGSGLTINNIRADASGTLFATAVYDPGVSSDLVTIDPITGTISIVGDSGEEFWAHGMSFDATDTLYLVNGDGGIYTVDTSTGAATDTFETAQRAHHGDFHPNTGKFWGIDAISTGAKNLRVMDVSTGVVEQTLPTVDSLHTLAFGPAHDPASPVNDDFDTPEVIDTLSYSNIQGGLFTATTALDDPLGSCYSDQGYQTVWYQYVADANRTISVDTYGSNYDTVLAAWAGSRGALSEIACNDDAVGLQSQVIFDVTAGGTYFIEVTSYGNNADTLRLNAAEFSLPTECTSGLCVIVRDALGNPVPDAEIEVYTTLDDFAEAEAFTNAQGYAQLFVEDGNYIVAVSSYDNDRFLVMQNVSAPQLVNIDPTGTVPVTISARKLNGTPLMAAFDIRPSVYSGFWSGIIDADGQIVARVTPGTYVFLATSWNDLYYLGSEQVISSGPATVNLHAASLPTGQVTVSLTDFASAGFIPWGDLSGYTSALFQVTTGSTVTLSAMDYQIWLELPLADASGSWEYEVSKDFSIADENLIDYQAGGDFNISTTVNGVVFSPGDPVSINNVFEDGFGNSLQQISYEGTTILSMAQDGSEETPVVTRVVDSRSSVREKDKTIPQSDETMQQLDETVQLLAVDYDPSITVENPAHTIISEAQDPGTWYSHDFTLPNPGMTGVHTVTLSLNTGPHMGVMTATDTFNVGNIAPVADFDGDGDTDLSVFKVEPWAGMWYVKDQDAHAYGNSESIPVSCDYNGDGQTDVAVYNAGTWYVEGLFVDNWGDGDSIPVPGDYDGDGSCELAVFKVEPWAGMWYIQGIGAYA